jgi:HSP20 family protein
VNVYALQCTADFMLKYDITFITFMMPEKSEITKSDSARARRMLRRPLDDIFDAFRRDLQNFLEGSWWPHTWEWKLSSLVTEQDIRMPLCDLVDKGDKYEVLMEVPGIAKEKVDIKATRSKIEVSGQQESKMRDKEKNYVYNERSYHSFGRRIALPEDIVPSKIEAKMENGILRIDLPKKIPTKIEDAKVEIK